jgi:diguanylate cyclase (GGDEF)-like protein/PAS domain S-box-containing protein
MDAAPGSADTNAQFRSRLAAVQVALREFAEIDGIRRIQALHWALFQLTHIEDPSAFFAAVHMLVGELMQARNFGVVLRNPAQGRLDFAYFVDERESVPPALDPAGRTLPTYVLRTGQTVVATPEVFNHLVALGEVDPIETPLAGWLGVPVARGGIVYGVIVVQSYDAHTRFTESHGEMLALVAEHVAVATERRQSADALHESELRFRTLAETAPCAIMILQGDEVRFANSAARELSGHGETFLGRKIWDVIHPSDREVVRRQIAEGLAGRPSGRYEVRVVTGNGQERWAELSSGMTRFEGRPGLVLAGFDVSERKAAEARIRTLAYHDPLTGLPNRLLFDDRLQMAIADAHRRGQRLAVVFLDLDHFKHINDSLGHKAGDEVLQVIAHRVREALRTGDTVARLGGDEFVLLLTGLRAPEEAAVVAQKVLEIVRAPVHLSGRDFFITGSIGICVFPDDGQDAEALLKNADTAVYRAKERGRDNCQLFTPIMHTAAVERLEIESGLRQAMGRGELLLHYQPILDLRRQEVCGVEALLRWNHPVRGLVSAPEFIPVAESSNLIVPLGLWTLRTALQEVRRWQEITTPDLTVAVNLAARHFQQPDLVDHIAAALAEAGVTAQCLVVEITETQTMQNAAATARTLARLKDLGVRIAIDDFGTGYSSLSYLKHLPIHSLKIDRSFVADITQGQGDAAIARAIIMLAHTLQLTVVAEGVETAEQLQFLEKAECDMAQGFLYSRPLSESDCEAFLRRNRPHRAGEKVVRLVPGARAAER